MSFRHYFYTTGEPWNGMRLWVAPRVLYSLHALLMGTVRITSSGEDRARPFREREEGKGAVFVTWHDLTLPFLHLLRDNDLTAISSRSRSARLNAAFLQLMGIEIVWGSAGKREGVQALRAFLPILREGKIILIAPDGPKGPRHRAQPGILYMASRAPALIYPWGLAATSAWRLKTWDRHLIPKPFSHVHFHMGKPLEVPSTLARDEIDNWQETVNRALDDAEADARAHLAQLTKVPLAQLA
jgi:lysophospholipid acyltransferase (LPLAT)-like uncharacterized protein